MRSLLLGWVICLLTVALLPRGAWAFEYRICVRPPDVAKNVMKWAYPGENKPKVITADNGEFLIKSSGHIVYVYDPWAPPSSVERLPEKWSRLVCPPPPSPPKPAPAMAPKKPKETKPQDPPPKKKDGATKKPAEDTQPPGDKPLTEEEKAAGAITNAQMNEDLHRPDGKEFGIVGGMNPDGPNDPRLQAAMGAVLVSAAVHQEAAQFINRVREAIKKGQPVVIKSVKELSEDAAKYLAKRYNARIAKALAEKGVIGPYKLMKTFTDNLGGTYQAHHILEDAMMKKWRLGKPDLGPSVILSDTEHKLITARLRDRTPKADTLEKLWYEYKQAYVDQPDWLKAIASYFGK